MYFMKLHSLLSYPITGTTIITVVLQHSTIWLFKVKPLLSLPTVANINITMGRQTMMVLNEK